MIQITLKKAVRDYTGIAPLRKELNGRIRLVLDTVSGVIYDGRAAAFLTDAVDGSVVVTTTVSFDGNVTEQFVSDLLAALLPAGWLQVTEALLEQEVVEAATADPESTEESIEPVRISTEPFSHIFDRENQIQILLSSVQAFVDSGHQSRFHSIMWGPPGCGKTETLRSIAKMLGPHHATMLDGPSTTKAGAEQLFLNADRIKPFVLVEEIEKMQPHHMLWLLQLLDERGEIRKTTAKHGHQQREARVLCIATVNDLEKFRTLMHGALSSRFAHEVFFPRPDNNTLRKIVLREIEKVGGNPAWAEPAINYCAFVENNTDPRRLVSVCLSGRDGLLDGTYLRALYTNYMLSRGSTVDAELLSKLIGEQK